MIRLNLWICCLLLFTVFSHVHADELETVKLSGREYVRLIDFCEFYGFPEPSSYKPQKLKGPYGTLELFDDDRKIEINGYRAWLSLPIRSASKGLYISRVDVDLLLAPILRPKEVVPRRQVKGVVIDPGHGGADRGARAASGYTEKQATLFTGLALKKLFEQDGIDVVMTRTRDVFLTLDQRARIANKYPDHIFISLHYNSVNVRSANGIETFSLTPRGVGSTSAGGRIRNSDYKKYNGNAHDLNNAILMNYVHEELMTMHTEKGDRGLKRARFLVLREVKIPAVLVEAGFMSHYIDARLIQSESYKNKVAAAVYRATKRYIDLVNSPQLPDGYGLKPKPKPEPAPKPKPEPKAPVKAPEPEKTPKPEVETISEKAPGPVEPKKPDASEKKELEVNVPTVKAEQVQAPVPDPDEQALRAREQAIVERLRKAIEQKLDAEEAPKQSEESPKTESEKAADG